MNTLGLMGRGLDHAFIVHSSELLYDIYCMILCYILLIRAIVGVPESTKFIS